MDNLLLKEAFVNIPSCMC